MATPVEMFNELIKLGYIRPLVQHADLMMPNLLRTVPSVTTSGTATVSSAVGELDAELGGDAQGDRGN